MAFKIKINKKVTGDSPYGTNKFQLQDLPIMKVHYSTVLYVTKKKCANLQIQYIKGIDILKQLSLANV